MYNTPTYYPQYAQGGSVKHGLAAAAEQLRQRGRGGDTILAHINPQEAGILKLLGGAGTINPRTGLPEFGWFKDTFGISTPGFIKETGDTLGGAIKDIGDFAWNAANDVAEALGPVGVIVGSIIHPALGAAMAGLQAPGNKFDWKSAAITGATAYAGGELMGGGGGGGGTPSGIEGFAADPVAAAGGFGDAAVSSGIPIGAPDAFIQNIPATVPSAGAAAAPSGGIASLPPVSETYSLEQILGSTGGESYIPTSNITGGAESSSSMYSLSGGAPQAPVIADPSYALTGGQTSNLGFQGAGSQGFQATDGSILGQSPSAWDTVKDYLGSAKDVAKAVGPYAQTAALGTTAYGMYKAAEETAAQKEAAEKALQEREAKKAEDKAFAESVLQKYSPRYSFLTAEDVQKMGLAAGGSVYDVNENELDGNNFYAKGGIAGLAGKSMMPPRFLSGGGDGMSDSIPARIEDKQEARLADGEFVVPADVVSHIGNGSSKAGAKRLYEMMDRVRQARTGKTRQAPQVNAKRLLPA